MATQLQIPKPCQEKWHEMTPEKSDRRHCAVCEKSIVDFSYKTDAEILLHLRENNGKVCGRFRPDQLNRPVLANAINHSNAKRGGLTAMAASFAALLSAQQPIETPVSTPANTEQRPDSIDREVMGKVMFYQYLDTVEMRSISGKILDEMNEPVIGASIQYADTQVYSRSDANGFFNLNIPMNLLDENHLEILIRYTGYPEKRVQLPPIALKEDIALKQDATRLDAPQVMLGEVIVVKATPVSRTRHFFRKWFR